jgi:hypothetical protein
LHEDPAYKKMNFTYIFSKKIMLKGFGRVKPNPFLGIFISQEQSILTWDSKTLNFCQPLPDMSTGIIGCSLKNTKIVTLYLKADLLID